MAINAALASITISHGELLETLESNQTLIQTQLTDIKAQFEENQHLVEDRLRSFETQMEHLENVIVELSKEIKQLQTSINTRAEHKKCHMHVSVINHFSHRHPLHLICTLEAKISGQCGGCKLQSSGCMYACNPCSYILHVPCSQMPQLINHPTDLNHPLSLLPRPACSSGLFLCNACGRRGDGFSYHCALCRVNIHIQCASMPLFLAHRTHRHALALTFFPPLDTKRYRCNICRDEVGNKCWRYRCNECDFDAHPYCARDKVQAAVLRQIAALDEDE